MTYQTITEVVSNKACVGCGTCSYLSDYQVQMEFDKNGHYKPVSERVEELNKSELLSACPFANEKFNESTIGTSLFEASCEYNELTGYYNKVYAGYSYNFRNRASSGGIITWILNKMLEEDLVDEVIHVKSLDQTTSTSPLFNYSISRNSSDLEDGMKSKYYPIEMSQVLNYIAQNNKRFVFVGLPCFCKSVRYLQQQNPVFEQRIKFVIGLVCGHLKSRYFAESIAQNLSIKPKDFTDIDFRVKENSQKADEYYVKVSSSMNTAIALNKHIIGGNWGLNFFRNPACNLCDDVFAETSDIVIGDAWIRPYIKNPLGTSIIIVRNKIIGNLMQDGKSSDQIYLDTLSIDEAIRSQFSGLTDRRQGLKFRINIFKRYFKRDVPKKRFMDRNYKISLRRKLIYLKRLFFEYLSHKSYVLSLRLNTFFVYKLIVYPAFILEYILYPSKSLKLLKIYLQTLTRKLS